MSERVCRGRLEARDISRILGTVPRLPPGVHVATRIETRDVYINDVPDDVGDEAIEYLLKEFDRLRVSVEERLIFAAEQKLFFEANAALCGSAGRLGSQSRA